MAWFEARLHGEPDTSFFQDFHPDLTMKDVVSGARLLGDLVLRGKDSTGWRSAPLSERLSEELAAGATVLSHLPQSFEKALDGIAVVNGKRPGSQSIYGPRLTMWVRGDSPLRRALLPIFEAHLAKRTRSVRYPRLRDGLSVTAKKSENRRRRLTVEELARLKSNVGWDGDALPRRDEVVAHLKKHPDFVVKRDAAVILGLTNTQIERLDQYELLSPAWPPMRRARTFFYRKELLEWMNGLWSKVPIVKDVPPSLVTLNWASRHKGGQTHMLIARVSDGSLQIMARLKGERGLRQILIRKGDIGGLRQGLADEYLISNQMAQKIFVSIKGLSRLRSMGLIPKRTTRMRAYNTPEDVDNFRSLYISGKEMAELSGLSRAVIAIKFRAMNLLGRGVTPVFRRSDVNPWIQQFQKN